MISRKANLSAEPLSEEPMIGPMPGLAQQPH
jgi:hypothetical protein